MKNATIFLLMIAVLPACNSVTDGIESQNESSSISVVTTPGIYDCTSVSGYVNEPTCNVITGAYCDGAWQTFPDGSLGFCYIPRTGWESCALNPGKWVLNANAGAYYSGPGFCRIHSSVFGCNSDVCKCDDTVLPEISGDDDAYDIAGDVGDLLTKTYPVGKTIPATVNATCEFGGADSSELFTGAHTIGDCKDIERIVNQTGDLATHTGTENGKPAYVTIDGAQVSVCVVPVPRGSNVEPTTAIPDPSGLWNDPAGFATNWQLDIGDIHSDPNLGCPSGWTKAATTVGGMAYYGILKTHSFIYPAAAVGAPGNCAARNFVVYQAALSVGITSSLFFRFPDFAKLEVAPTCAASVWSENPTAAIVKNDLTHVVCY